MPTGERVISRRTFGPVVGKEPSAGAVSRAKRVVTQWIVALEMATNAQLLENILMQRAPPGMRHAVKCPRSRYAPQGVPRREEDYGLVPAELAADCTFRMC